MPKCKNCGHDLTIFDKDICPFCGFSHPFDEEGNKTDDLTQIIDNIKDKDDIKLYKRKKKNTYVLLLTFLGFFAAHLLYVKRYYQAMYLIVCNLLFVGGAGALLSLIGFLPSSLMYLYWIISFGIIFLVYVVLGILVKFKGSVTDSDGQILK